MRLDTNVTKPQAGSELAFYIVFQQGTGYISTGSVIEAYVLGMNGISDQWVGDLIILRQLLGGPRHYSMLVLAICHQNSIKETTPNDFSKSLCYQSKKYLFAFPCAIIR